MRRWIAMALMAMGMPAAAQNMTTAAEVKPIVEMIKAQWVAVRLWEGNDLLYFTTLLSWRCGIEEISYSVNGGDPIVLKSEPCYEEESAPNALKMEGILPYVTLPADSVKTVQVMITFDDGTKAEASYERAEIQMN